MIIWPLQVERQGSNWNCKAQIRMVLLKLEWHRSKRNRIAQIRTASLTLEQQGSNYKCKTLIRTRKGNNAFAEVVVVRSSHLSAAKTKLPRHKLTFDFVTASSTLCASLLSRQLYYRLVLESQPPPKTVNSIFQSVISDDKMTILWGS